MFTVFCVLVTALVMLTGRDRSIKIIAGLFFVIGMCLQFSGAASVLTNLPSVF